MFVLELGNYRQDIVERVFEKVYINNRVSFQMEGWKFAWIVILWEQEQGMFEYMRG